MSTTLRKGPKPNLLPHEIIGLVAVCHHVDERDYAATIVDAMEYPRGHYSFTNGLGIWTTDWAAGYNDRTRTFYINELWIGEPGARTLVWEYHP